MLVNERGCCPSWWVCQDCKAFNEPFAGYRGAAVEQHSNAFHSQWFHCLAEEPLVRLPALQLGFERRCSHIKTPHQLPHIVFLGCWHTLVHGHASACIFFLQRRWKGRKPPDKNIVSFSSSHPLFAQQLFGLSGYLCFLFFPATVAHILHLRKRASAKCANWFHVCMSAFFREPPPHTHTHSLCYCLFCRLEVNRYNHCILNL